jgi:hypothetical protein
MATVMPDYPASVGKGHFRLSPLEIEPDPSSRGPGAARARAWESQTGV